MDGPDKVKSGETISPLSMEVIKVITDLEVDELKELISGWFMENELFQAALDTEWNWTVKAAKEEGLSKKGFLINFVGDSLEPLKEAIQEVIDTLEAE